MSGQYEFFASNTPTAVSLADDSASSTIPHVSLPRSIHISASVVFVGVYYCIRGLLQAHSTYVESDDLIGDAFCLALI